jgi:hypothetical protein
MTTMRYILAVLAASLICLVDPVMAATGSPVTAFIAVNVVPMDSDRVLAGQTVLVQDGRIIAIGSRLAVPAGAQVIDGRGTAYLSPGLADMHTHADTAEDMQVYLANGVTTVLNMGEASNEFNAQVRPAVNAGKSPGPHIYAGFLVDGTPQYGHFIVTTPAEARALVGLAKTNGYDFIKVYNNLTPECFQALVEEGRRLHLQVIGHGVTQVGLERQLALGQVMVAHTEEFLYTVFSQPASVPGRPDSAPSPDEIPRVVDFVSRDKAFITADLNTYATIARQWGKPAVYQSMFETPEFKYLSPRERVEWRKAGYMKRSGDLSAKLAFLGTFTRKLEQAGVPLITGTDAPTIPGLVPGFSLHDDLQALEAAGLSRYQVLSAATRIPGEFIDRYVPGADRFGTVTVGSRADLVLSERDPLEDLTTLRRPLGVMAAGAWHPAADLQAMLAGVAAEYAAATAHR